MTAGRPPRGLAVPPAGVVKVAGVLVALRFLVSAGRDTAEFLAAAQRGLQVLSGRSGFVDGRLARATDDQGRWLLLLEWSGVGAWRRALSSPEVTLELTPLLAAGVEEPSGYEVLARMDGGSLQVSASDVATAQDAGVIAALRGERQER